MTVRFGAYIHSGRIKDNTNPKSPFSLVPQYMSLGVSAPPRNRSGVEPRFSLQTFWDDNLRQLITRAFSLPANLLMGELHLSHNQHTAVKIDDQVAPAVQERLAKDMKQQQTVHLRLAATGTLPNYVGQSLKQTNWRSILGAPVRWLNRLGTRSAVNLPPQPTAAYYPAQ